MYMGVGVQPGCDTPCELYVYIICVCCSTLPCHARAHMLLCMHSHTIPLNIHAHRDTHTHPTTQQVHLLSATPLLLDRLIAKGRVDLSTCRMLVLDEADRLFEGGFVKQVDVVLEAATNPELV